MWCAAVRVQVWLWSVAVVCWGVSLRGERGGSVSSMCFVFSFVLGLGGRQQLPYFLEIFSSPPAQAGPALHGVAPARGSSASRRLLCHNVLGGHETCHRNYQWTQHTHSREKSSHEKTCAVRESCRAPACPPSARTGCRCLMVCRHPRAAAHLQRRFGTSAAKFVLCALAQCASTQQTSPPSSLCRDARRRQCTHRATTDSVARRMRSAVGRWVDG